MQTIKLKELELKNNYISLNKIRGGNDESIKWWL